MEGATEGREVAEIVFREIGEDVHQELKRKRVHCEEKRRKKIREEGPENKKKEREELERMKEKR